jgi:hypothetical protein
MHALIVRFLEMGRLSQYHELPTTEKALIVLLVMLGAQWKLTKGMEADVDKKKGGAIALPI